MGLFKKLVKAAIGAKEFEFNVAGVTFKNGRRTRQAILRAMKFKDMGYEKTTITLKKVDFEGKPAIEVWANEEQIGYVPKDLVPDIISAWKNEYQINSWGIVGGGDDISYGCKIKAIFR